MLQQFFELQRSSYLDLNSFSKPESPFDVFPLTALDSSNTMVKKQVIELLAALSRYSGEGYNTTLQALEFFKVSTANTYAVALFTVGLFGG